MSNEYDLKITMPIQRPFENVFQFRIDLLDTDFSVWRRIQVPESYTFYDLHVAIQDSIGWFDCHLHDFEIPDVIIDRRPLRIECPFEPPDEHEQGQEVLFTTESPLKQYLKKEYDKALYHYDYGDGWEIALVLEKILPRQEKVKYPICTEGERAGPPEDCGGTVGYERSIEVFENQDDEDLLEWLGDWRPEDFDPERVEFWDPRERLKLALDLS
jgi:hypothetical protein